MFFCVNCAYADLKHTDCDFSEQQQALQEAYYKIRHEQNQDIVAEQIKFI